MIAADSLQTGLRCHIYQVLRDAFELQSYALVNCAAACVCKNWQDAVNSSFVRVLHLHIHNRSSLPSTVAQWGAFLAARSSIGELKLTAGDVVLHALQSGHVKHLSLLTWGPFYNISCRALRELLVNHLRMHKLASCIWDCCVRVHHIPSSCTSTSLSSVLVQRQPYLD